MGYSSRSVGTLATLCFAAALPILLGCESQPFGASSVSSSTRNEVTLQLPIWEPREASSANCRPLVRLFSGGDRASSGLAGTGCAVGVDQIATATHVLAGHPSQIQVDGAWYNYRVARRCGDFSLIQLDRPLPFRGIEPSSIQVAAAPPHGSELQLVIYDDERSPAGDLRSWRTVKRSVSVTAAVYVVRGTFPVVCSLPYSPGASGSPVFQLVNGEPRLVGTLSSAGNNGHHFIAQDWK